jgi:hypothetical protein
MTRERNYLQCLNFNDFHIYLAILVMALSVLPGCEKQDIEKQYTGSFNFTVLRWEKANIYETTDTFYYQGTITFNKSSEILTIHYLSDKTIECNITKDGTLESNEGVGAYSPKISGSFSGSDEINFNNMLAFSQYSNYFLIDKVKGTRQ